MAQKRIWIGRVSKACEKCGKVVERQASQFRAHVFCSKECYWSSPYRSQMAAEANARRLKVGITIEKPCEHCGTAVIRPRSQYRNRTFCSRACRQHDRAAAPVRQVTSSGYIKLFVGHDHPGADSHGHMLEHRKVMQDLLDRPLLPDENVHHKNGVRDDNRPENLELWSKSQPCGQRVADKLAWAREFIALYEGDAVT